MFKQGFDNDQYLKLQSQKIKERINFWFSGPEVMALPAAYGHAIRRLVSSSARDIKHSASDGVRA